MIIPSIDLMDGKAVQLVGGEKKVLEDSNVVELMKKFSRFGETAIIDLDRAFNKGNNLKLIKELCKIGACRVGGGLKTIEDIEEVLRAGATKVIIGSSVFSECEVNTDFLEKLTKRVGKEKIIIATDCKKGKIAVNGWKKVLNISLTQAIDKTAWYCGGYLITSIEKEGRMKGVDFKVAEQVQCIKDKEITIAGGLSNLSEIEKLASMGIDIQVGMSLYTNNISIEEGFLASLKYQNGLIPVVTTDETGQVLMQAYASKDSLRKTFKTGYVTYYSRSRQQLWTKGETSGNTQKWINVKADCDRDSLLVTVKQNGVACHTDRYSCFEDKHFSLFALESTIRDRIDNPKPESYTSSLTKKEIERKILEEANELVNWFSRDNLIWEAADVFYFVLVYLSKNNIKLSEVIDELERRSKK